MAIESSRCTCMSRAGVGTAREPKRITPVTIQCMDSNDTGAALRKRRKEEEEKRAQGRDALRKYLQPQQAPAEAVVNNPLVSSSPKATESEATASQAPISSTLSDTKLDLLDPGGDRKYPEKIYAGTGRTCKLHPGRPKPGLKPESSVLGGERANHCKILLRVWHEKIVYLSTALTRMARAVLLN
ncbi:uncharacterized protein LOC144016600 [Festucalex cinctus]